MSLILQFGGKLVDVFDLQPGDISIDMVAKCIAATPRFRGQTFRRWSVAQHCMLVEHILALIGVSPELRLAGLLHDAAEVILGDIPTPVKAKLWIVSQENESGGAA